MKKLLIVCVAAAFASAACGKSEAEKKAEEAAKGAEQAGKAAEQAAKGFQDLAKAMAGGGDAKPVDPVSFRDLQALLPEVSGWTKGTPSGERMTTPVSFSQTEVEYTKGDARIEVKIVDSGFHQLLLAPYAMFLATGYERESSTGYEKSTTINGQPGWEKWNKDSKDGEVNALVGKRFLVTIDGNGIDDTKVLHEVANKIDMGKLASLK